MTNPVCPETGAPMYRGVRPMTLTYKGESLTFDMPGWYCDQSEESIHTGEDMKISDRKLNLLKARCERLLEPEEIRRIRKKLHLFPGTSRFLDRRRPAGFPKIRKRRLVAQPGGKHSSCITRS